MKIDRSRVRKSTSDVPIECQQLIDKLQQCSRTELLEELSKINTWTFGKCELLHWAQVLDIFDRILGSAAEKSEECPWALKCDSYSGKDKMLLICILRFTSLLIEHSFSRHLYNSMEHLLVLLMSNEMNVVLEVLNLLYMFSKRSNFITRLKTEEKDCLLSRLQYLAESWGGNENGFGLADCCSEIKGVPISATTLHVEFHKEDIKSAKAESPKGQKSSAANVIIHIEHIDKLHKTPAEIMRQLVSMYYVPPDKEMWLFTHVRLACQFANFEKRLKNVQARLQALSVLVYSNAIQDSQSNLLYSGILEELVEVVELTDPQLTDIRCAALRTLTAIIHLDRNPQFPNRRPGSRLNSIIDVTGASQYHGFLPSLVRNCISSLTETEPKVYQKPVPRHLLAERRRGGIALIPPSETTEENSYQYTYDFPVSLTTALFSFLYHLASYDSGGEALVSCGMMESLLQVINWQGYELDHITFVTRAVRVIDLITNIDMAAFQAHGGLMSFIQRLDLEVEACKDEQLYVILPPEPNFEDTTNTQADDEYNLEMLYVTTNTGKSCLPQRAALLKSLLNFLKKAFQDATFAESIRHLMEGPLPSALKNIIANAEYYGPSLFLLATDVVTVYVYQEPSLLTALQDNGLTEVVLHALLVKEVPATREVLGSLPNVFSALCLNARGLESFAKHKPFDKLFHILLSPVYLPAMRRRRSAEPSADTACNLGSAMDELMRHQPSLRQDATLAIISLLEELVYMGTDPKYVCWRPHGRSEVVTATPGRPAPTEGSSDEEDDDEDETSTSSQNANAQSQPENSSSAVQTPAAGSERQPIALIDYVLNAMKFIDAILSNNSTDDHCREFVQKGGLKPLLQLLGLPNLPADCPVTNPAQAVATVCKSILNLAHEPFLFQEGLQQLSDVLDRLKPLTTPPEDPVVLGGSRLLMELAGAPDPATAFNNAQVTPLLHAMGAAHGYVLMFVHVCRTGQTEIRSLSLQHWGKKEGVKVLRGLAELYTALVWESTLLLAYCSDDLIPSECDFTRESIEKLNQFFDRCETTQPPENSSQGSTIDTISNNSTTAMDFEGSDTPKPDSRNLKYIKPLLGASSRLGRALAELFGLLVKLSVGSPVRQRRGQNIVAAPPIPTIHAKKVALALNLLLSKGLDCDLLPPSPSPKCRLTFLICSVGFTSPMLFDERRFPYHLMLKKFVTMGGQTVFFKTFKWALNNAGGVGPSDVNSLPDGTLGFLDAWLTLLEKMVNPKAILESPHTITTRPNSLFNFDPLRYLIQIQRLAFDCIERLWKNTSITSYGTRITETVLTILKHFYEGEKIIREKLKEQADSKEQAGPSSSSTAPATARVNEDSLKQLVDMGFSRESAVEALLHSNTLEQATDYLLSNPSNARASTSSAAEPADPEDDQMLTAIAISLGINNILENPVATIDEIRDMLDEYGETALPMALDLLDKMPELVHKSCELLVTIMKRNGVEYRDTLLESMVYHLTINAQELSDQMSVARSQKVAFNTVMECPAGRRLANYTHLFILFFEVVSYYEMKLPFMAMFGTPLADLVIQIINQAEYLINEAFIETQEVICPKWLAPCLLLIDAYAKVSSRTDRKGKMHISTTRIWQWYDLTTGRWTHYSAANNKVINDAYWAGEQKVKVTCGRKRYTITFPNMLQMNEESGNNRPVAMSLLSVNHSSCKSTDQDPPENPLFHDLTEKERKRCIPIPPLSKVQMKLILQASVRLLHFPLEKDVLHSILQVCVRFTRSYEMAKVFVEAGGIKCLLKIKHMPDFGGFGVLATILIRHSLEEPSILKFAMEKVIRGRALSTIPPPYRDCIYLCRQLGAAVTRDPDTFYDVSRKILRVDTTVFGNNLDVAIPLRVEPVHRIHRVKAPPLEDKVSIGVLHDLLDELLKPLTEKLETTDKPGKTKDDEPYPSSSSEPSGSSKTTEKKKSSSDATNKEKDTNAAEKKEDSNVIKPMLPKSVILKILADSVVSYCPVAKLITEYTYKASEHKSLIKENTSALAFMFDKILPESENISDSDCSTMSRMFIASLASSNHAPEAQLTLVSEVKAALGRAVALPESHEKHTQIQHICAIISTMIDNCPVPPRGPSNIAQVNNIIKMMIRRGLFNDLAKITHHLDLSSPYTPFTANAALKPLESLSRTINQPGPNTTTAKGRKPSGSTADASTGTSTQSDATSRLDEEDTENTEDNNSEATTEPNENDTDRDRLEEIMEQILNGATERVGPNAMDIDDVVPLAFDTDRDPTEELMSTDSGESDSNPSDDNDEDGNNDDDDEDDDGVDVNMEDNDDNDDENNYEDDDNNEGERRGRVIDDNFGNGREFRMGTTDRDEDVLMIHYENENESALPRMIRWNENGFSVPMLEDNSGDHVIIHPLLLSRNNGDTTQNAVSRGQRTNRTRRYQYLLNPRNPNPPVILQRLLGTQDPHAMANMMTANNILAAPTDTAAREQARVVIMDNFGIIPPNEEQIDFVDQSGYLFGPSLAATLSHVPPVVHWWNMESKLLDLESVFDCASWICNRLMPDLIKHMNEDLKKKKAKEDEKEAKNRTKVAAQDENLQDNNKEESHLTYVSLLSDLPDDGEDHPPFLFNYADEVENDQTLGNDDDETTHTEAPPVNNAHPEQNSESLDVRARRAMLVATLANYPSDSPSEDSDSNREREGGSEHHPSDVSVDVTDVLVEQNRENFSQVQNHLSTRPVELRRNNVEEEQLVLQPYFLPNRDDNSFDSQASLPEENTSSNNSTGNSSTAVQVQSDRGADTIERLDDNIAELESNESFNPFEMRLSNDADFLPGESSYEDPNRRCWSPVRQSVRRSSRNLRTFFEEAFGQHLDVDRMHAEGESSSSSSDQNTQPEEHRNNPSGDTDTPQNSRNSIPSAPPAEIRESGEGASAIEVVAATASNTAAGPSSAPDDEDIPEGVDPSFLEALPPEIRREVLEQHRILTLQQRLATRSTEATAAASNAPEESNSNEVPQEVSPEFLAALPPALQEEVLTQQRLEQQRQAAARAPPNEPVDAHAFFQTLQPSLRTMILSDMEDSQINALPPELAAEAQHLRRDWYARNRQMATERFLQSNLPTIIRQGRGGRGGHRPITFQRAGWPQWSRDFISASSVRTTSQARIKGRQLLDHEGIACLLILLFTDDPHLNKLRLHRVIRNLCYHGPTRDWVINALLTVVEKSVNERPDEGMLRPMRKGPRAGPLSSKLQTDHRHLNTGGHWLTIRMEAALGCAANVFLVAKGAGKKNDRCVGLQSIGIHPQAAPIVCRNALDLFTALAKTFPSCILPIRIFKEDAQLEKNYVGPVKLNSSAPDFWDTLLKLDNMGHRKGKALQKSSLTAINMGDKEILSLDNTVFGRLLNLLGSPTIHRNTQLADNLLKLLSVTTQGMPELIKPSRSKKGQGNDSMSIASNPPIHSLSLAVNVITYKNCSEEGLEFITNLLLNLAASSQDMSYMILNLLVNGAVKIGLIVENQINSMLGDLAELNNKKKEEKEKETPSTSKGVIFNRFTKEQVIVTASSKAKAACELQLPSMAPLISKTSSQIFFLRILRVIVQIRNSIKNSIKRNNLSMDLAALSDQLFKLEDLWETLSKCLLELEHAPDQHAVLVLQPAVEAFFLVHSPQQGQVSVKDNKDDEDASNTGENQDNSEGAEPQAERREAATGTGNGAEPPARRLSFSPENVVTPLNPSDETARGSFDFDHRQPEQRQVTPEQQKFLAFAEKHRTVLNQILRQTTAHLADGPFAVLVDHTRILDFDIKRRYFRTELERMDHGIRREETAVHVRRSNVFEDSFRELFRRAPEEWKNRFYIVFEEEEGQDAGGLLREWYVIISRDIFNPMYALFTVSPGDRVTYMINSASHYNSNHLCYYKFVGRVIAKAIYDNKLLECYFTRSFYKHILGIPVKYTDMESEDYSFYRGLIYLMENNMNNLGLDLTFSTEISEFGVTETRDLIANGRHIPVTEDNKMEYVRLVCQMKMTGAIKQQLSAFLDGFYDIIPMRLISIFNEQELELLISGLPNVDIDDLKSNTEYHKYQSNSLQIQWFWRALRSFDQADRAKFLQFVTGTSKVPLQGFGALEGMNGVQKFQIHRDDRSTDRLPSAHTCFNQLDLPVYETYDKLRAYLLKAIHECSEGFGFA